MEIQLFLDFAKYVFFSGFYGVPEFRKAFRELPESGALDSGRI